MDWKDSLRNFLDANPDLPAGEETAPVADKPQKARERLTVVYEKKGRKGKPATIVAGFACDDSELSAIASELKQALAVGGSARGGEILLQGDCRNAATELLRKKGYRL